MRDRIKIFFTGVIFFDFLSAGNGFSLLSEDTLFKKNKKQKIKNRGITQQEWENILLHAVVPRQEEELCENGTLKAALKKLDHEAEKKSPRGCDCSKIKNALKIAGFFNEFCEKYKIPVKD